MEPRSLVILALCVASAQPSAQEALSPLEQVIKSRSDASSAYANEFAKEYEPIAYAAIPLHNPMPVIAILSEKPMHQYAASYKQHSYAKPEYQNDVEIEYPSKEDTEEEKPFPEFQKLYPKYQKPQEHPKQYAKYEEPHVEYQKPYPEYQKYAEYESPYPEYQQHAEYQKPLEYKKPYVKYQKPYVQYQKPDPEYQRPYVVDYPKYVPMEYVKPYPEQTRAYAPVEYVKPYPTMEYRPVYDRVKPWASVEAPTILYARPSETGGYTYHRRPQKKRNVKRPRKEKPVIIRVHKHRVIRSRRSYPDLDYRRRIMAGY